MASSRSATATPTWWMPRTRTRAMLLGALVAQWQGTHGADGLRGLRLRLDVGEERLELRAVERLLLEQRLGDPVERVSVLQEKPLRLVVRLVGQSRLLRVAQTLRLL